MDEASLEASIDAYKQQLQQIETVLQSAGTDGLDDLLQLRKDLKEVIELTQGSLLSLRKSNLLSYVDDIASETERQSGQRTQNDSRQAAQPDTSLDEEFAAFQAAIADDVKTSIPSPKHLNRHETGGVNDNDNDDYDYDDDDDDDGDGGGKVELDDISGTKCSIIYRHEWGAQQRHNAVVLSVEPPSSEDDEARVRVLFCNPTNAAMKPCPFFFKGECRFSEDECRFSHGYIVKVAQLKPFQDINLSQLSLQSKCLAKYEDDIWYPAVIKDIDSDAQRLTVCFESYGNTMSLEAQDTLPVGSQGDNSSCDDDDNDDDSDEDDGDDEDVPSTSSSRHLPDDDEEEEEQVPAVLWTPSGPSCRLGEWEAHTRGIGSKLMAMMGYEVGKGLGKHGEGRTEPVEAVIIPQGKSLDTCMKLKEMKKLGIVGKKKKRKKKKKKGKDQQGIGGISKIKKPRDVFEFINTHLGAKKVKINELLADNTQLVKCQRPHREESKGERAANNRQLNVQLLKTQEEVQGTKKRLVHLQQSLARNQRDKSACAAIQSKMASAQQYLDTLKSSERKLERQRNSRDQHKKLTIF